MSAIIESSKKFFLIEWCLNLYKKLKNIFGTKALVAFAIVCAGIYKFRAKKHDNIPLGPGYEPILGHSRFINKYLYTGGFLKKELEIFQKLGPKCPLFAFTIPSRTQIYIADPKLTNFLFTERFSDSIKSPLTYDPLKVLLGDGIFTTNGSTWRKHRSIASRMFTLRSLRDYMFKVFVDTADLLLNKFDEIDPNNNGIDCYDMFNRLTFEAFTKIAFGVDVGEIKNAPARAEFGFRFDRCLSICTYRIFSALPWEFKRKLRFIPGVANYENEIDVHSKFLENYVNKIIENRLKYYNETLSSKTKTEKRNLKKKNQFDLLSLFIDDNKNISSKELRDIAFSFIIAGKDTTAQMLSWFMYHIFTNNLVDIQNKIRNEIKNIFGESKYNNNKLDNITYENIMKCNYIECCLKESLRLYPSVPHLVRSPIKDIKLPNGYTLRKGDEIFIATYVMGRLPWIWDDPLTFKPERFSNKKKQPSQSKYPAFNLNPRLCLGRHVALMEGIIAVVKIFTKYKNISAVKNQPKTEWVSSPTNQMDNGFKVHFS